MRSSPRFTSPCAPPMRPISTRRPPIASDARFFARYFGADVVEDHADARALGERRDALGEVLGLVVDGLRSRRAPRSAAPCRRCRR